MPANIIPKMNSNYNKIHKNFKLNGTALDTKLLIKEIAILLKAEETYKNDIGSFLKNWLDEKEYVIVNTSGSTGAPKQIKLSKQAMVHSAIATGFFFNLNPGDKALHCLPSNFIAGKMMLVRAMILGLELDIVEPKSQLNFNSHKHYDFCAMLPMQLEKSLNTCSNIKTIIVGGAPVSENLKSEIAKRSISVYETYGMTETITHIAVKKLNSICHEDRYSKRHKTPLFNILPNIKISQDERNCLVIDAPRLTQNRIVTNDIVKLHSTTKFEWLGRYDNIINSGGLKISPEHIEQKLAAQIQQRFFVASEPDSVLGERLILVIEGNTSLELEKLTKLSKLEMPKAIYVIPKFIETSSGKLQRQKTLGLLK